MNPTSGPDLVLILRLLATIAAALGLAALCVLLLSLLPGLLRLKDARQHTLRLTNQGNVRSAFHLAVESPHPALRFQLALQGIPLAELAPPPIEESEPAPLVAAAPRAAGGNHSAAPARVEDQTAAQALQAAQAAGKTGKAASAFGGALAGFLGLAGSLLPGKYGQGLRARAASMRQLQVGANRAMQMPAAGQRRVTELTRQGEKLGMPHQSVAPHQSAAPGTTAISDRPARPVPAPAVRAAQPARARNGSYHVQTGEVGPGESLELDLRIQWKKIRRPASSLPYTVRSLQVPLLATGRANLQPVARSGVVFFKIIEPWRYGLYYLSYALVVIAALAAFVALLTWLW